MGFMKKYLAQAAFKSSDSEVKYSMYIGTMATMASRASMVNRPAIK
jgi:hypothetical protein